MVLKDRHSLENRLAAAHADLKNAQIEHSHACLLAAQNPKNTEAAALVEQLEGELHIHERTIARLEAAKLARVIEETEDAKEVRRAFVRKAMKDAARLETEIRTVTEKIALKLEALAPLGAQLEAAIEERNRVVKDAVRTGFGRAKDRPSHPELYTAGAFAQALKSALIDSGLTRGQLANSITIAYPERFTIEQMREKSAKQSAFIADAMQSALAAIDRKEGAA